MKNYKLFEIADLQTGLVLSRKESSESEFIQYKKISLKSIDEYGEILQDELEEFKSIEYLSDNILSRKDDIIIKLFNPLNPCIINDKFENLVVPAQLGIIRPKDSNLISEYLMAFLSQDKVNQLLVNQQNGGTIRSLKLSAIGELEIPIPALSEQEKIVKVYKLQTRQKKLMQKLKEEQETYNKYVLDKLTEVK